MHRLHSATLLLLAAVPAAAQTPAKPKPGATPAKAEVSLKEAKLTAIESWLTANKTSPDRAEGLNEAANLAFELSNWIKAKTHAETYLKESPKGQDADELQLLVGRALAATPASHGDAKKIFEKIITEAGEDKINAAVNATDAMADLLLDMSGKDEASKAWDELREKYHKVRGIEDLVRSKQGELEEIGEAPKAIDVTGIDGKPIKLADLKGKIVLIDFWATWCVPCVGELPNVIATYKKFHPQGFEIVGISLDRDEKKLRDFVASHDMPWAQFFDGKNEIAKAYEVQAIPRTYLLDREGKVQRIGARGPALGRAVERLLAAKDKGGPAPAK